jgi:hypothetical protein
MGENVIHELRADEFFGAFRIRQMIAGYADTAHSKRLDIEISLSEKGVKTLEYIVMWDGNVTFTTGMIEVAIDQYNKL